MSTRIVTVDVREDIRVGRVPFSKIMLAVDGLRANEDLLLIAPFEPVPLFEVLAMRGFSHIKRHTPEGDWEILFTRQSRATESTCAQPGGKSDDILEVDARGLEPPEPLIKIMECLSTVPAGRELRAHTDRKPMHLFPLLAEKGFIGESEKQKDGSFITRIRRR
jgi:uncharacterized protein (DUF2249 family)